MAPSGALDAYLNISTANVPPYHEGTFEGAIKEFAARSSRLHATHPARRKDGGKDFRGGRDEKALCKCEIPKTDRLTRSRISRI